MAEYVPPEPADAYVVYEGAELPAVDADSVLLEHRYERTVLQPGTRGAEWDLGAWIRADRAREAAEGEFQTGGDTEVVAPGWALETADLPKGKGSARIVAERATAAGFEVRCQASIVYVTPTLFAASKNGDDGHTKGELRFPDHDDTWWSVQARLVREGRQVAAFWATWRTKEQVAVKATTTFRGAVTWDLVLGRLPAQKAGDFSAWFDVFAPPAVVK